MKILFGCRFFLASTAMGYNYIIYPNITNFYILKTLINSFLFTNITIYSLGVGKQAFLVFCVELVGWQKTKCA